MNLLKSSFFISIIDESNPSCFVLICSDSAARANCFPNTLKSEENKAGEVHLLATGVRVLGARHRDHQRFLQVTVLHRDDQRLGLG